MKLEKDFKFKDIQYTRPDCEAFQKLAEDNAEKIKNAVSYSEAKKIFLEFDKAESEFFDMGNIAYIRHTIDTSDEFYDKENEFLNEKTPELMPSLLAFSNAVYDSRFKPDFVAEFGEQMFAEIELRRKSFSEKNIPLLQKEARLCNEYEKIIASADILFDGKHLNLYGIMSYFENPDRNVRHDAYKAYSKFYESNEENFERIWDELIKVRTEMGNNLGFENYIPLGYMNQGRTDYDEKDVAAFREQVREELVPFCAKLYEAQAKRIGVDKVKAYDEAYLFNDGNAVPVGDDDFLIEQAREMYHDMSKETGEFVDFMLGHDLLDVKNKPKKASTGYMTGLNSIKAPFVFSCFNHTTGDVQVLTHEFGHAFAGYMAMRNQPVSTYYSESTDIAEIHSMSMEQFAYPYAEKFFGDKADKFRFSHLQEALTFVPFGVAVDEYQHIVYANPELTPKQRTAEWKKLEEKYMPWREYDDIDFFAKGGWWYHKIHIFLYPFYYINYTLTTMGAMEFKKKMHEDKESAWKDYLNLCKVGGSLGYKETLKYANLSLPFEKGSVKRAVSYAEDILLSQIEKI
mgnify:FL=1